MGDAIPERRVLKDRPSPTMLDVRVFLPETLRRRKTERSARAGRSTF